MGGCPTSLSTRPGLLQGNWNVAYNSENAGLTASPPESGQKRQSGTNPGLRPS